MKAVIPEVKRKKESSVRRETQNNAMTKKQLLKIQPEDKIVFNPPFTRFKFNCIWKLINLYNSFSVSSSNISVSNPTENDVIAFKIKTTAPKRYCVRPNVGLLKPGETSDVKVLLQPGETDEKHKFQVQSLVGQYYL